MDNIAILHFRRVVIGSFFQQEIVNSGLAHPIPGIGVHTMPEQGLFSVFLIDVPGFIIFHLRGKQGDDGRGIFVFSHPPLEQDGGKSAPEAVDLHSFIGAYTVLKQQSKKLRVAAFYDNFQGIIMDRKTGINS